MPSPPTRVESPDEHVFDRETARAILACNDRDEVIKLLAEMKEKSMRERMNMILSLLPLPYLLPIRIMNSLLILS